MSNWIKFYENNELCLKVKNKEQNSVMTGNWDSFKFKPFYHYCATKIKLKNIND